MILSIVATTLLSLVLYLSGFFVILTPLPVLITLRKKGYIPALVATGLSLLILGLLYGREPAWTFLPMMFFYPHLAQSVVTGFSLIYFAYYLWMGWVIAYFSRQQGETARMEPSMVRMVLASVGLPAFALILFAQQSGFQLTTDVSAAFQYLFQKMIEIQQNAGVDSEELLYLKTYAPKIVERVVSILPSLWVTFTLLALSLNILLFRRWLFAESPFPQWKGFSLWRLREGWIWVPILCGVVYFLNLYLLQVPILATAMINLLIVLGAIYFLQGLAVASFYFRNKLPAWTRWMAYFIVFLFIQIVGVFVIIIGVFDFWFDFRKLKKID